MREPERLRALQHLLDQVEETAGVGHWTWDAEHDVTTWSPAVYRIHGFEPSQSPPDLAGVLALYPPDDAARLMELVQRAIEHGEPYQFQAEIVRPDGASRRVSASGACERGDDGKVRGLFGTFVDVTDLKLADERLRMNEARLAFLMEHSPDVIVRIAPGRGITWVSPSCRRYGYEPQDLVGERGNSFIHPDDVAQVEALRQARLNGEEDPPAEERRFRFRCKDGTWIWVEGNPTIVRDESGRPVEVINVLRDITARKEMEDRLTAQEARYRLLADHATDVIACYGTDEVFTFVSPAIENLLGFKPEELVGRSTRTILHPDDVGPIRRRFRDYMAAGPGAPPIRYEYRAYHKDGRLLWLEAHPRAIYGADGKLVEFQDAVRDVTARREMEDRLAASEMRYRLLADYATDVISCQTADGIFTFVSPSVEGVLGYAPHELIGTAVADIIHSDDVEELRRRFDAYLAGGEARAGAALRFEYRAIRKDGSVIWLESNDRAIFDPATGEVIEYQDVARDVTERKAAEAALAESELRNRVIAENATDVITRASLEGVLTYASPSILNVTGYGPSELTGEDRAFLRRLHPDDLPVAAAHVRRILAGELVEDTRLTYRFQCKDDRWIWLECNPTVVRDADGQPIEILDVLRDVSAQHQIEADLRAARDAAEAAAQVKSDFLANMSHEIRTPLTAILGFTRLLRENPSLDDAARLYVDRVGAAGDALLSIVNDILDFSKLEAGLAEISPRPTDARRLLEEALAMFSPQADAKRLSLALAVTGDLPPFLAVDPERLRQMLLNLLGNAMKFTQSGSVRLVAEYRPARQRLRISVEDTGPGLSRAQQAKLFQRFSQVDASSTRPHGGTGLGLAICKGLAQAMGGTIAVRSTPGRGSVFHFEIPAPPAEAPAVSGEATLALALEDVRILVVDDNAMNRELLRAVLGDLGAEVCEAADGTSGVEVAESRPVDLILMDVRMPGMTGPEALAAIRAGDGPNRDVPILAFTADGDPDRLPRDLGFDGVVRKPVVVADMYLALAAALGWIAPPEGLRHAS